MRLPGANVRSLDAYLRGLGLLRACDRVISDPPLRWSWDSDGILVAHGIDDADELVDPLVHRASQDLDAVFWPIATPWRGSSGKDRSFRDLRNEEEDERLLDWFDACGVAQTGEGEVSSRHNPLLGQGGGFGRSELAAAAAAARAKLRKAITGSGRARAVLHGLLLAEAVETRAASALQISKKAIGAYQSGRGTGPGASRLDVNPSGQPAATSAWDLLLVLEGLRHFRGALVRRPGATGREQASFPLLVRSSAVSLGAANRKQDRIDDDRAYEVLAPLWTAPMRARTVASAIARARLRVRTSRRVNVARDALDAVLGAGASSQIVGFDRVVRFVLYAPSDPRYRYALSRGVAPARALPAARRAISDVLPFLRAQSRLEPRGGNRTAAHRYAEHELEQRLADVSTRSNEGAEASRAMISALTVLERAGARAHNQAPLDGLNLARLGPGWRSAVRHGEDEPAIAWRLASAIAGAADNATLHQSSWLRSVLLPQHIAGNAWRLHGDSNAVDLTRASRPVARLISTAARHGLSSGAGVIRGASNGPSDRGGEPVAVPSPGGASSRDLAYLLADGGSGPTAGWVDDLARSTARVVSDAARLETGSSGNADSRPKDGGPPIGVATAWLLLAAQPAPHEVGLRPMDGTGTSAALARRVQLAALAHRGDLDGALRVADAELRRRGIERGRPGRTTLTGVSNERLALALLLGLSANTIDGLAHQVGVVPDHSAAQYQEREGSML